MNKPTILAFLIGALTLCDSGASAQQITMNASNTCGCTAGQLSLWAYRNGASAPANTIENVSFSAPDSNGNSKVTFIFNNPDDNANYQVEFGSTNSTCNQDGNGLQGSDQVTIGEGNTMTGQCGDYGPGRKLK